MQITTQNNDNEQGLNQAVYVITRLHLYHVKVTHQFTRNPGVTFIKVFNYFMEQYGSTVEDDRLENEGRILTEWHPTQGFHILVNQLEEGIIFGQIIRTPVMNARAVNIGLVCIKRCGLFANRCRSSDDSKAKRKTRRKEGSIEGLRKDVGKVTASRGQWKCSRQRTNGLSQHH